MTCEGCGAPLTDAPAIGGLGVCASCLRTVVAASGQLAKATDTLGLDAAHVEALKARRKAARKAKVTH